MEKGKWGIAVDYHRDFESSKWEKEIPDLKFPTKWKVRITPPIGGAVIRFQVRYKKAYVSIYLDCYNMLGYVGAPYWEVYPVDGDVHRCDIKDRESLMNAIEQSIKEQNR